MQKIVIIMGSKKDIKHARGVDKLTDKFEIPTEMRVASAHKTPELVMDIIDEYRDDEVIFITIAGRSNALSGFVDANTSKPVIASPPYSEKFAGGDILSSLRMPSGVAPMVVLGSEQAALAAAKIFSLTNEKLRKKIEDYQKEFKGKIKRDDEGLSG